jgi:caffeoyl-CoA O-methyltransferase
MGSRSSQRDGLVPRGRGGDIVFPHIEKYLEDLEATRDSVLIEMERQAAECDFPIVGPLVGRTICLLARSIGARRILELGSGFGYSAYWFARALPDDGELILTEISASNSTQAKAFFRQGGVRCRVQFIVGDALENLDRLPGEFDIIFNDVDKEDYPRVFRVAVPRIRKGGLLVSDNTLWHGDVADPAHAGEPSTRGILEFNRLMFASSELYPTILPLRDGVAVAMKL